MVALGPTADASEPGMSVRPRIDVAPPHPGCLPLAQTLFEAPLLELTVLVG
jgi:hypothetical protein